MSKKYYRFFWGFLNCTLPKMTSENIKRQFANHLFFSIVTILIVILISLGSVFLTQTLGIESTRSATRIGYVGNEGYSSWNGKYTSLNGTMKKSIHPKTDMLHIEVKTDAGVISIEIQDADGNVIFDEYDIGTASFDVAVPGKVVVRIIAESHKGSFLIE